MVLLVIHLFVAYPKKVRTKQKFTIETIELYQKTLAITETPIIADPINPCQPSPCGLNSQCQEANGHAVCSCLPNYVGSPPNCRPECVQNSECPTNLACINFKCKSPCLGLCGINAECTVIHHRGICQCALQYTGDPFTQCVAVSCNL